MHSLPVVVDVADETVVGRGGGRMGIAGSVEAMVTSSDDVVVDAGTAAVVGGSGSNGRGCASDTSASAGVPSPFADK